ncbi:MAG: hypothetical protein ACRCX2_39225 [Paraclostridium sp.]
MNIKNEDRFKYMNEYFNAKYSKGNKLIHTDTINDAISCGETNERPLISAMVFSESRDAKDSTGNSFLEPLNSNATLLSGTQEIAKLHWNIAGTTQIANFEQYLYQGASENPTLGSPVGKPYIFGYNLFTDGAVGTTVIPVDRKKLGYDVSKMIPFRMIPLSADSPDVFFALYVHRRVVTVNGKEYVQYFTKRITDQTMTNITVDGDILPDNPHDNLHTTRDVRTVMEFNVSITQVELGEYFQIVTGSANNTMHNAIGLFMGNECTTTVSGKNYNIFRDTKCSNRVNYPDRLLADLGTARLRYALMYI